MIALWTLINTVTFLNVGFSPHKNWLIKKNIFKINLSTFFLFPFHLNSLINITNFFQHHIIVSTFGCYDKCGNILFFFFSSIRRFKFYTGSKSRAGQLIEQSEMPGYCIRKCVVGHRVIKGNVHFAMIYAWIFLWKVVNYQIVQVTS